jgi:hypothetical protein
MGIVEIGDIVIFRGVKLQCYHKTKHRKAPQFKFVKN